MTVKDLRYREDLGPAGAQRNSRDASTCLLVLATGQACTADVTRYDLRTKSCRSMYHVDVFCQVWRHRPRMRNRRWLVYRSEVMALYLVWSEQYMATLEVNMLTG